jgi:hypothetical protein
MSEILGRMIGSDNSVAFANNDAANTQKTIDIALNAITPSPRSRVALEVYNPSTETDLRVKLLAKAENLGGSTRYCLVDTVVIPKAQAITGTTINAYLKLFEGLFIGENLRLVISNDTAVGAAGAFSTYVRVREV